MTTTTAEGNVQGRSLRSRLEGMPRLRQETREPAVSAKSLGQLRRCCSIVVDHARGAELWDVDGRRYIDFAGGIGVLNAGHTPPSVVEAIKRQSEKLIHTCFSVAFYETYIDLCARLNTMTSGDFPKKIRPLQQRRRGR